MPTYGYRCEKGHEFEIYQAINDDYVLTCQVCGAPVRRIFYPVGIVFKGPGFYKTDSRGSSASTTPAPATADSSPGSEKTDSGGDKADSATKPTKKADKKPAAKPEARPESSSGEKKSA